MAGVCVFRRGSLDSPSRAPSVSTMADAVPPRPRERPQLLPSLVLTTSGIALLAQHL